MHRPVLIIISVVALLNLAGCFGGASEPVPADHYYRLALENAAADTAVNPTLPGSLAIKRPLAHGLYQERPLLFVRADNPLELRRHHYHHWADSPARLVQEDMLHYLQNTGFADRITRFHPGKPADYYIASRLNRFERILADDGVSVIVSLELEFYTDRYNTLIRKEYTQSVNITDRKVYSTIQAFDEALRQIYRQFMADIRHRVSAQDSR